jgi:hypothetical protein
MHRPIQSILFASLLCICTHAGAQGYSEGINTVFHPTQVNPAFAVSPLAYDRAYMQLSADRIHLHAQKNIDAIYTAAGLGAEWRPGTIAVMPVAAYHTYFLPSNEHLMLGARAKVEWNEGGDIDFSYRIGLLMYSNPGHRHFMGATWHIDEHVYSTKDESHRCYRSGYGLQLGHGLPAISRNTRLNTSLFVNYYPENEQLTGPVGNLLQSQWQLTLWRPKLHYGAGWQQENLEHHQLMVRVGYSRKMSIALALLHSININNNTRFELSIKTNI